MSNQSLLLTQVHKNSIGFALANHVVENKGNYLCLVESIHSAELLYEQVRYFVQQITQAETSQSSVQTLMFRDRETLAYDVVSPPLELVSDRLQTLSQWQQCTHGILIVAVSTALHRLPPKHFINRLRFDFKVGQKCSYKMLLQQLVEAGYERVAQVIDPGCYSQRGGLIDVFPMGCEIPFRIDFFDDEIDQIRAFDVHTQRSINKVQQINVLSANEYVLNSDSIDYFKQRFEHYFPNAQHHDSYQKVSDAKTFAGIEYFLPLLHSSPLSSIDQYCPSNTIFLLLPGVKKMAKNFYRDCQQACLDISNQGDHLALPTEQVFLRHDELLQNFEQNIVLQNAISGSQNEKILGLLGLPKTLFDESDFQEKINHLLSYSRKQNLTVVFSFSSSVRTEILQSHLASINQKWSGNLSTLLSKKQTKEGTNKINNSADSTNDVLVFLVNTPLENGFIDTQKQILFCSESDVYGKVLAQKELPSTKTDSSRAKEGSDLLDLSTLQEGQLIVHIEHGIGIFRGLEAMEVGEWRHDALAIEYQNGGMLYVPIDRMHYVDRYVGNSQTVTIDQLGNNSWNKRKDKAKKRIVDVAAELLEVCAKRDQHQRKIIPLPQDYEKFSSEFPHVETLDQNKVINEILNDLSRTKPMDRLICGDVGFGKTEIAMRSAFVMVANGKQVVILVPTTILAHQHYRSFSERFAGWAVRVEMISRLRSDKEIKQTLNDVAEKGKVDIVIGTHRLLQKDVKFNNLGLAVIDEEHRFGVRQKETFKKLRSEVDMISMTATPIPRTLNLTFSNLRDVSILSEAPAGRLSIQTFVLEHSDSVVKEAILRELKRGGQIYFVHNSIATIERRKQEILDLIPDLSIGVAHGRMLEKQMEAVMKAFYLGQYQILLCTTIIETGLDLYNANTIIIDRADKFGLAQLHQLRGRVGRSFHQAYAYLFIPEMSILKSDARRRLITIQEHQKLGSGFRLALEDMEIRGSGEILGEEQKGHIQKIGLNLYAKMLNVAVQNQKSDSEQILDYRDCEIDMNVEMLFPEDYMEDVSTRLLFYQRISDSNEKQLDDLWMELYDRFAKPPQVTENLFDARRLKLKCLNFGVESLKLTHKFLKIKLGIHHKLSTEKIIDNLQRYPEQWKLSDGDVLHISRRFFTLNEEEVVSFKHVNAIVDELR